MPASDMANAACTDAPTAACFSLSGQAMGIAGDALGDLREVYGSGLQVRLSLMGLGGPGDLGGLGVERGERLLLAMSRGWGSWMAFSSAGHSRDTRAGAARAGTRGRRVGIFYGRYDENKGASNYDRT